MKSLDDTHVKMRLCQFEIPNGHKGWQITEQVVWSKYYCWNIIMKKRGFEKDYIKTVI